MGVRFIVQVLLSALLASGLHAQEHALILADEIMFHRAEQSFSAVGNVQVHYAGNVLQSDTLDYRNGVITVSGPLSFSGKQGTVGVAEYAELDRNFRGGVLRGVQMLVADRVRFAGESLGTDEAGLTQIRNAIVTTCNVCRPDQPPIWHFRSRRVIHDPDERQLYLEDVDFYLGSARLVSLPYVTMPDPTVNRRSGFLFPEFGYSSGRGLWTRIPYFRTLGDHADMTLTPGFTTKGNLSLELEHRQMFRDGRFMTQAELLRDRTHTETLRGHYRISGNWDLGDGYRFSASGEDVTDPDFLADFGLPANDAIESSALLTRRSGHSWFSLRTRHINRTRDLPERIPGAIPFLIHDARFRTSFSPATGAGTFGFSLEATSFERKATSGDRTRDVTRGSVGLDWRKSHVLDNGLVLSAVGLVRLDGYRIKEFSQPATEPSRTTRTAALEASLPLRQVGGRGKHIIEPFAQFVWSPKRSESDAGIPNEDSVMVEFDETNLLSLDRFAGRDRNERGARLNLGIRHTGSLEDGTELEMMFGRVLRNRDLDQFSEQSGLAGKRSHYLASGRIGFAGGLVLDQRAVFDSDFGITKSESFVRHVDGSTEVAAGYSRLLGDQEEGMSGDVESVVLSATRDLGRNWAVNTSLEYDFNKVGENAAGIGLEYRNQCLLVTLDAERQMRTVSRNKADTKIQLKLSLAGFTGSPNQVASSCGT